MKKTLSITIGGMAYTIEEDAYKTLDAYVTKIRTQFKNDPNVDELIADMEAGIADVFEKQLNKRKNDVLTHVDVKAMIQIMGEPEEIAEEEPPAKEKNRKSSHTEATGPKRLYRNTDDVIIAGVCSGIAAYAGIDPVIIRIAFILLGFVNGLGILAYLILWIAIPKAETSAQKLEMRGKPINLAEIEELAKEKAKMMKEEGKKVWERAQSKKGAAFLQIPMKIIETIIKTIQHIAHVIIPVLSVFIGTVLIIVAGAGVLAIAATAGVMLFGIQSPYVHTILPLQELVGNTLYYTSVISGLLIALIPLLLLITLAKTLLARRNRFLGAKMGIMTIVWFLAVGTATGAALHVVPLVQDHIEAYNATHTITQEFKIEENIEKVLITGQARVRITQGDVPSITFHGWEQDLETISVSMKEGQLQIEEARRNWLDLCILCYHKYPEGEIILPSLTAITAQEDAKVWLEGFQSDIDITAQDDARIKVESQGAAMLKVTQSDDSRVILTGTLQTLLAEIKEDARLIANDLSVETVEITATDNSRANVRTSQTLKATAQSRARITYSGNPEIKTIQELDKGRITNEYED